MPTRTRGKSAAAAAPAPASAPATAHPGTKRAVKGQTKVNGRRVTEDKVEEEESNQEVLDARVSNTLIALQEMKTTSDAPGRLRKAQPLEVFEPKAVNNAGTVPVTAPVSGDKSGNGNGESTSDLSSSSDSDERDQYQESGPFGEGSSELGSEGDLDAEDLALITEGVDQQSISVSHERSLVLSSHSGRPSPKTPRAAAKGNRGVPTNVLVKVQFTRPDGTAKGPPVQFGLHTMRYALQTGVEYIDLAEDFRRLQNGHTPLQTRTSGNIYVRGAREDALTRVAGVQTLLSDNPRLAFPPLGRLKLSGPDDDDIYHAYLFWEEPEATTSTDLATHSSAITNSSTADDYGGPLYEPEEPYEAQGWSPHPHPAWNAANASPTPRKVEKGTKPLAPVLQFFQDLWNPKRGLGQAKDMASVRKRIVPLLRKLAELDETMEKRNNGGWGIPRDEKYPRQYWGMAMTKVDIIKIFELGVTQTNQELGWLSTHVGDLPEVEAWMLDPENAPYADLFNRMTRADFKRAFEDGKYREGKPEWRGRQSRADVVGSRKATTARSEIKRRREETDGEGTPSAVPKHRKVLRVGAHREADRNARQRRPKESDAEDSPHPHYRKRAALPRYANYDDE